MRFLSAVLISGYLWAPQHLVSAGAAAFKIPDEIAKSITIEPGPGLPSLESLNLTVADIVGRIEKRMSLEKRADWCQNPQQYPIGYYGAKACYEYLLGLDTTPCSLVQMANPGVWMNTFCTGSDNTGGNIAVIAGASVGGGYQSSYRKHVAHAVREVMVGCPWSGNSNWIRRGEHKAYGNGNLIVETCPYNPSMGRCYD